jgi:hypothetical protein
MSPRMMIACDNHVAFIISHGNASPSALSHPLWLRLLANENACVNSRLRLIGPAASLAAVLDAQK